MNLISFDIPHNYDKENLQLVISISAPDRYSYGYQRIDLGSFNAWSTFVVNYEADAAVSLRVGPTNTESYAKNHQLSGSERYLSTFDNNISLFISFTPSNNRFDVRGTDVVLNIRISNSSNYSSNWFLISFIPFMTYFIIYHRNKGWSQKVQEMISEIEKVKAKRVYQSNHALCDLCGVSYEGVTDANKDTRYCSKTCHLISHKTSLSRASYFLLILAPYYTWILSFAILSGLTTIFVMEKDEEKFRYQRYITLKQHGKIDEITNKFMKIVNAVPMKFVDALNQEYPVCCYQTARLDELYCECGRSVPSRLREYLQEEAYSTLI